MKRSIPLSILTLGSILMPASGAALIEESFDYDDGINANGTDGGLGFGGAWSNTFRNPTIASPDLTWGELLTSGNSSRGGSWSGLVRPLGTTLADAGLLDNGATLWFSVIFDLEGQNTTNADLSLSLGSSPFNPGVFGDRENLADGEGIGVTHSRATIQGVYWQDTDDDTVAERVENNSNTVINGNVEAGNLSRALIVGRIDWGAGDDDTETLTLYAPGEDLVLGDPTMEAWSIPALDQAAFNQIALQYKDSPRIDEIRLGATSADVLPTAAGPPVSPVITSISEVDEDLYELSINGSAETAYAVSASESLDFENNALLVTGFTQNEAGDPGTISGPGDDIITTDADGNATFRVSLTATKNFIRLQAPVIAVGP